jgi:hypothetical protein
MKKNQYEKRGIFAICILLTLIFACKRVEFNNNLGSSGSEIEQRKAEAPFQLLGAKQVTFLINTYASVLPNFRPTADSAFRILSTVISSKEFQDSIAKYSFPCSNGESGSPCIVPSRFTINKCIGGGIAGTTVYDDFLVDDTVRLDVKIIENTSPTPSSYGFASKCFNTINTYSYWLTNNRTLPLSEEYAIHLAHEYAHIVGYVHPTVASGLDVNNRVGSIVRNILWKWHLEALQTTALHTVLLTEPKYRFLAVNPPTMPQTAGFNAILQSDITTTNTAGRSYNHFYLDFNPPSTQRKSGSNIVVGVTTAASSYWIEYNYYEMQWVNSTTGIVSFTYKDNNGSTPTTASFSQNLRTFLESHTFKIDYSENVLNVGKVMGKLTCVEDPSKVFYGQFESSWSNW